MRKLYRITAQGIIDTLAKTLSTNARASRLLEKLNLANPKWGSGDRNTVHRATYEILRWKNYYSFLSGHDETVDKKENLWSLLGVWLVINNLEVPDWEEFKSLNPKEIKDRQKEKTTPERTKSIPSWLYERGKKELSREWNIELDALNIEAKLILRVNRIVTSPKKLQEELHSKYNIGALPIKGYEDALLINKRTNLRKNPLYLKGSFEIQDANSQKIGSFTDVKPGMNVIDGCAGAGGKTLHLASLMRNKGDIIALDVEENKLKELKKRARRNRVKIIKNIWVADAQYKESLSNWADRVLIDAPCSGLGTLKRNPDLKWKLTEERISEVIDLQRKILLEQSNWVKKGGKLIYVTCSILPSENQDQISWFLKQEAGKAFDLEKEETFFSHQTEYDGFYAARLIRR